jgi:hypothetical protein
MGLIRGDLGNTELARKARPPPIPTKVPLLRRLGEGGRRRYLPAVPYGGKVMTHAMTEANDHE